MKTTTALTTLLAAGLVSAGATATATAVSGDATATVGAPRLLTAGATAPFDAAGVKAVRRGKAIPAGYVLVGRTVTVARGASAAGAAARLTCPAGKSLRTLGSTGTAALQITGNYLRHRSTIVFTLAGRADVSGAIYGVCR